MEPLQYDWPKMDIVIKIWFIGTATPTQVASNVDPSIWAKAQESICFIYFVPLLL